MIQPDLATKFDIPSGFKDFPLSSFSFSVRLSNVLQSLNFQTLGDLHGFSVEEFKSTRHCGEKSVRELISVIEKIRGIENGEDLTQSEVLVTPSHLTLTQYIEFLDKFHDEQKPLSKELLVGRYGGEIDKIRTLEELAVERDLSRERIRQITSSSMDKLQKLLGSAGEELFEQIYRQCVEHVYPLSPLLVLKLTKKSASDFRFKISFYLRIMSELAPKIPILSENSFFNARPTEPRAYKIYREIRLLLGQGNKTMPVREIFAALEKSALIKNLQADEFLKVFRYVKDFSLNFDEPDNPIVYLTAKPKIHELAYTVLSESDEPLKPAEILERARKLVGEDEVTATVAALLHLPNHKKEFYLLDRRTIGLRKHIKFPEDEWSKVRNDMYKLLKKQQRSFSTKEVIYEKLFPWTSRINASELALILREDLRFVDLGRLNFGLKEWSSRKREKVADLIVKVLREADHPLQPIEMKQEIQKRRTVHEAGLSTIIRQHSDVKEYGYGFYGLKEWDDDKWEYLLSNETFIYRILIMSETPLRFGDMCKRLGIEKNQMLVKILWERLKTMPKTELEPNQKAPGTLILYNSFGKIRFRKKQSAKS